MKILIVEDDIVSSKLMKRLLESYGTIDIAYNGKTGIEMFEKALDEKKYDFITLDIMMPEMTGHQVLKKIREIEEEKGIVDGVKIIMTTALGDFDNVKSAYREQCEAYIIKPIIKENLIKIMKELEII